MINQSNKNYENLHNGKTISEIIRQNIHIFPIEDLKKINYDDLVFSPIRNDDSDRNERSTPREFLLPATPAVAEIQEQRRKEKNKSATKTMSAVVG